MGEQLVLIRVAGPISEAETIQADDEFQVLFAEDLPGVYDGYDWATDGSGAEFYFYGPDSCDLFVHLFPELAMHPVTAQAEVILRRGPPEDGVEERRLSINDIKVGDNE